MSFLHLCCKIRYPLIGLRILPTDNKHMMATTHLASLLTTIAINGVYPALRRNPIDEVSRANPTVLDPATWAFSIWALIYTSMLATTTRTNVEDRATSVALHLSNLLNAAWIVAWTEERFVVSAGCLAGLTAALTVAWARKGSCACGGVGTLRKNVLGVYGSWTAGATVLNSLVALNLDPSQERLLGISALTTAQLAMAVVPQILERRTDGIGALATGLWTALAIYQKQRDVAIFLPATVSSLGLALI